MRERKAIGLPNSTLQQRLTGVAGQEADSLTRLSPAPHSGGRRTNGPMRASRSILMLDLINASSQ
jgi:hypothetical protein